MERPGEALAACSRGWTLGPTLSPGRHTTRPPHPRQPSAGTQALLTAGPTDTHGLARAAVPVQPELTSALGEKPPGEHDMRPAEQACLVGRLTPGQGASRADCRLRAGHCSQDPQVTTRRLPNLCSRTTAWTLNFPPPGPTALGPAAPAVGSQVTPRVVQRWEGWATRHRLLRTRLSTAQAAGSSCTAGRPLLGLRLCHCREPGTAPQRMGRKGPPAAGLLLSPRDPRELRITGAFSSALSRPPPAPAAS